MQSADQAADRPHERHRVHPHSSVPSLGLPKTPSASRCKASSRAVGAEGSARRPIPLVKWPKHTLVSALLLFLGPLSGEPFRSPTDRRGAGEGVTARRAIGSAPLALLAR